MVSDSVLMRSAIDATATGHLHNLGVPSDEQPMHLQSKALRHVSDALSRADAPNETTLFHEELGFTIIILIFYETTFGLSASTARWHLSAVYNILKILSTRSCQSQRFDFLIRLFAYFDILVAFSLRLEPLADPLMYTPAANPYFCPTFGYASSLYPHLHTLALLLARKYRTAESDPMSNAQSALDLELEFLCWQPPTASTTSENGIPDHFRRSLNDSTLPQDTSSFDRLLETALAFRSAALLVISDELLPETCPTPSSIPSSEMYYRELLDHLLRLNSLSLTLPPTPTVSSSIRTSPEPSMFNGSNTTDNPSLPAVPASFTALASTSAPMMTVTWPLYTASLHAKSPADRKLLSTLFERVHQRHQFGMLGAAKRHIEEIWKRDAPNTISAEGNNDGSEAWEEGGSEVRVGAYQDGTAPSLAHPLLA
jgi:Fungal specific transcription factor domain